MEAKYLALRPEQRVSALHLGVQIELLVRNYPGPQSTHEHVGLQKWILEILT